MVLIPLSKFASRGDQILNAESFERQGYASVLYEEDVTVKSLIKYVEELNQNNEKYKTALKNIMEKKQLKQSFKIFQRHDETIMPLLVSERFQELIFLCYNKVKL